MMEPIHPHRWRRRLAHGVAVAALGMASAAQALPMGFKDRVMVMGEVSEEGREFWANYAFTARDAIGLGTLRTQAHGGHLRRELWEANYTRRLHRINAPASQTNFWFVGGVGELRDSTRPGRHTVWSPGLMFDYETTRVYAAAAARAYRADTGGGRKVQQDMASLRAGFSFYEVNYDQTQPWFILEAKRVRGITNGVEWTPTLRFIHKRFFGEIGITNPDRDSRSLRLSFMWTY
jgi:hypothetical protein